jgi:hypothetical protein
MAVFADENLTMRARAHTRRAQPMEAPSPNGANGRNAQGRFVPGNQGGPGNPFARRSAAIRKAFLEAVSVEDIQAIVRMLIDKAKAGDLVASKLVLLWAIGRPTDPHHPDAVEAMAAAEAQAAVPPPPLPADPEARLDLAARALAAAIRAARGVIPEPGDAVEAALEDLDRPC